MSAAETIAIIRDIFIIIFSGVSIVILLGIGYALLRLYPLVKRATQNVERTSGMIHAIVSQPYHLITAVMELINRGLGMLEQLKKRERREEDD